MRYIIEESILGDLETSCMKLKTINLEISYMNLKTLNLKCAMIYLIYVGVKILPLELYYRLHRNMVYSLLV